MSRHSDVALTESILAMLDRRRKIILDEYADLAYDEDDKHKAVNRDLRMKKSGALDEISEIQRALRNCLEDTKNGW